MSPEYMLMSILALILSPIILALWLLDALRIVDIKPGGLRTSFFGELCDFGDTINF